MDANGGQGISIRIYYRTRISIAFAVRSVDPYVQVGTIRKVAAHRCIFNSYGICYNLSICYVSEAFDKTKFVVANHKRTIHCMQPFLQMGIGAVTAVAVSLVFILQSSFGESRHILSIIGAIAILVASLYVLRTRLIRWGNRSRLLKYHQGLASFGLCLVLIHSSVKPETWHSWLTFGLAWLNLGTGVAVSLTKAQFRRILLRCHLVLAPILLIAVLVHGREKLDHDEFFPLTQIHDVPCVQCHTPKPLVFDMDGTLEDELTVDENLSGNLQWEFEVRGIPISQDATVAAKREALEWLINDLNNRRKYIVRKEAQRLNIYADSVYKTYTCRTCHVHDTPDIQFAHEVHGVSVYDRCLDCHQTELHGMRYGKQRSGWEYDPNW